MPTETATLLFTAAAFLLIASGVIFLNREIYGRWSLLPFTVFLVLYNRHFLWGFLNYLFSVGLELWFLLIYLRLRTWPGAVRLAILTMLTTVLLVAHLHALASYGVIVVGYEISVAWRARREGRRISWRQFVVPLGQFVLPAVLFLSLSTTKEKAGRVSFGSPADKIIGLLDIFNNYVLPLDIFTFVALAALVLYGYFRARLRLYPHFWLPLVLLGILYLLLPQSLFDSFGADRRLLLIVVLVGLAGLDGFVVSRRTRWVVAFGLSTLFVVRMIVIGQNWLNADRIYADVMAAIDEMRSGSRVAVAVGGDSYPYLQNPPLDYVGSVAVMRKEVFINSLFAKPGHQVMRVLYATDTAFHRAESQAYRRGLQGQPAQGLMNPLKDIPLDRFDYLLYVNRQYFEEPRAARLKPLFERGRTALFAVDHAGTDAPPAAQ